MFRLGSLLVGGVIGAGIAMILNPRTGQETQAQLRERVKGLRDQYGPTLEQGRLRATELMQTGREILDQGRASVSSALERQKASEIESESVEREYPEYPAQSGQEGQRPQ